MIYIRVLYEYGGITLKNKVQVLMSTYNGSEFLENQLISILYQDKVDIRLLVRDDGSIDDTLDILYKYKSIYPNIEIIEGENIGVAHSFLELLRVADSEVDFYAFADQDDFWFPNKIIVANNKLQEANSMLYCSNTINTDRNLQILKIKRKKLTPSFGNSLIENLSPGCTYVFTKELRDIILEQLPLEIVIHDWWFYIIASYHNSVFFDENAYIFYRQHGNNLIGNSKSIYGRINKALRNIYKIESNVIKQINILVKILNIDIDYLDYFVQLTVKNKIKILFQKEIKRQSILETILYKIIILLFWRY